MLVISFSDSAPSTSSEWEQIEGSRILLIGGAAARSELRRLLDSSADGLGRPTLQKIFPGGMNSRTHTAMRRFVGL